MNRLISYKISLFLMILLNSCATVFLPNKQKVTIKTGSSEAKVYVDNEKIGTGESITKRLSGKGMTKNIAIVYGDDYVQKNDVLISNPNRVPSYYFTQLLNAPFIITFYGLYSFGIDAASAKTYAYPKVFDFSEEPRKLPTKNEEMKYVYLTNIGVDIKDADEKILWHTGTITTDLSSAMVEAEQQSEEDRLKAEIREQKKRKKKGNVEYLEEKKEDLKFENVIFTDDLKEMLSKGGFYDTINNVFTDNNNTLVLEGKITKLNLFNISPNKASSGYLCKARTDLTWYIKNTFGEIVDSVSGSAFSESFKSQNEITNKIIGNSITQSFYNLFEGETFKKYSRIETDLDPKLDLLQINRPNRVMDKRDAAESSVIIKTKNGHGSGFSITNDGYILTNYHVLVDREKGTRVNEFSVIDSDGNELEGKLVRYNKFRDLALIKVDKKFNKAFYCEDEKKFRKMDDVYTIGAPKSVSLGQSISSGIISNERKVNNNNLLQINMSINSGNSGGPIFDNYGVLHGVVVAKLVGMNTEGVAFAIPSYKVSEYLNLKYK